MDQSVTRPPKNLLSDLQPHARDPQMHFTIVGCAWRDPDEIKILDKFTENDDFSYIFMKFVCVLWIYNLLAVHATPPYLVPYSNGPNSQPLPVHPRRSSIFTTPGKSRISFTTPWKIKDFHLQPFTSWLGSRMTLLCIYAAHCRS